MLCHNCRSEGAEGKKYCADCGAPLAHPEETKLQRQVVKIFEEQFRRRDQKLLELETADAAYSRLKKMAYPMVTAIAIVLAGVGYVGYGKYQNAIEAIKATESKAVGGLKSEADKEAQSIRSEATNQRASLQATAGTETTALRQEAGNMRRENSRTSQEFVAAAEQARTKVQGAQAELGKVQQQLAALRESYGAAQTEITQLREQGTSLKQKYDAVGTQIAVLQSPNVGSVVGLSETLSMRDSISTSLSGASVTSLRFYSVGSSGPEVEKIQKRLAELGCYDGEITGQFDLQTKASVERFNSARGEQFPTAVIDVAGWDNLFGPIVLPPKPSTYTVSGTLTVTGNVVLGGSTIPVMGAVRCTN